MSWTHCTALAPGCHGGPDPIGPVISRHKSYRAAVREARRNDRLVVLAWDSDGYPTGDVLYRIPQQDHPALGSGRYGRGLGRRTARGDS